MIQVANIPLTDTELKLRTYIISIIFIIAIKIYSSIPTGPMQISKGLVTNYGEGVLQNVSGGHVKFYPYEKGGQEKF